MKIILEEKVRMTEGKAYWIKADNHVFEVEPDNGKNFSLEELQTAVGGYIEFLRVPGYCAIKNKYPDLKTRMLVVNEEGKLRGLPLNETASDLAFDQMARWDFVAGDALYVESDMVE